ncbi:MAG: hypothetical protein GY733_16415 [bacterium]|nr:hypothetical protein [bacterium]
MSSAWRNACAAAALAVAIVWIACAGGDTQRGRVLLIGIDGATHRVIEPMLAQGHLPHLARLAREGASGALRSTKPIVSPRIWNTIATGVHPSKHGILHFSKPNEEGGHELFLSVDRKARALWTVASHYGRSVGVVNFWNTYPPERINGVMVSDHLLAVEIAGREILTGAKATPQGDVIHPRQWHERLSAMVSDRTQLTSIANPFAADKVLPASVQREDLHRHYHEDSALVRIAEEIEREIRPDLAMVLLPGIDRISHFLWGVVEPAHLYPEALRPSPAERAGGKQALFDYYAYTDALIGRLIAGYTEEDLVLVVSDHGFEAAETFMVLTGGHESDAALDGVIFACGPGIEAQTRITGLTIDDIAPTILAFMGLPVAHDLDGRIGDFIALAPPEHIASFDDIPVALVDIAPSGVEHDIIEQLRTLGYLEPDTENPGPNDR